MLTTAFTKFDKRVEYNIYDVTNLLNDGCNAIGAYLGNGWYNSVTAEWHYHTASWRSVPKMIIQLEILTDNDEKITVYTNSLWKGSVAPAVYNHLHDGEIYDARMEKPGWNIPGFDDADWQNASVCASPGGIYVKSNIEPIRVIRTLEAKYLGNDVCDFGENTSGWVRITAAL